MRYVPGADLRKRQAGLTPRYGMVDGTSIPVFVSILAKPNQAQAQKQKTTGREGKGRGENNEFVSSFLVL